MVARGCQLKQTRRQRSRLIGNWQEQPTSLWLLRIGIHIAIGAGSVLTMASETRGLCRSRCKRTSFLSGFAFDPLADCRVVAGDAMLAKHFYTLNTWDDERMRNRLNAMHYNNRISTSKARVHHETSRMSDYGRPRRHRCNNRWRDESGACAVTNPLCWTWPNPSGARLHQFV
jgi:hypothetical protein